MILADQSPIILGHWDKTYRALTASGKIAKADALSKRREILGPQATSDQKGKKKSQYRRFFNRQKKRKWPCPTRMEVNKLVTINWYRPKTLQGILAKKDNLAERERILSGPARTEWQNNHRRTNLNVRLRHNLSHRMNWAVKNGAKKSKSVELLGCSIESFKIYLESKFEPGMSWENYGPVWHIDHIMPCAIFDLTKAEHQKRCFHFSNLQPLFAMDNMRKHTSVAVASTP